MKRHARQIDPRELIPATRPKRTFQQGPIPAAPIIGSSRYDLPMTGVTTAAVPVEFVLPTTRVKPRGIVFVYDMSIMHTEPARKLNSVGISRQAPEDPVPYDIFFHLYGAGVQLPYIVNLATPLPFPFGGDAIYNYIPIFSVGVDALGGLGALAVLTINWVFYEWDAAAGTGGAPALGGVGGAFAGNYKRFEVSE